MTHLRPAVALLSFFTLLTGLVYPAAMTGLGSVLFPKQAAGDSSLLGQTFTQPKYFWGRPSATSPDPYNAASSSGSNLGPTNPALVTAVKARVEALKVNGPIPVDLVTSSASGLDPHVSPAAALIQVPRVAAARGLEAARVTALVTSLTDEPLLGIIGERRVNVAQLNAALDALSPQ